MGHDILCDEDEEEEEEEEEDNGNRSLCCIVEECRVASVCRPSLNVQTREEDGYGNVPSIVIIIMEVASVFVLLVLFTT